ncbi:C4-dicarboxylate TRAP transporter substrate-binding protein [Acuticoccus sp.]|uniref:C4-dicarboxylate TRAP transporter substrate-binding protein n=1 Tax=Acuticoccus sp. TaxID=1904378 RepID=UPI003B526678
MGFTNAVGRRVAAAMAIAAVAAAAPAAARDLTYASPIPAAHVNHTAGLTPFFDRLREATDGSLDYELFVGGSMGGAKEMLKVVSDYVADSAQITPVYVKSDIPLSAALTSMMVLADDPKVFAAAFNDTMLVGCDACREEYTRNNIEPLAWYSTGIYYLMCTSPVTSVEDVAGKKIRATSRMGELVQSWGATPVSITTSEMYEALQRGQADCTVGSASWLNDYNLKDVIRSVLDAPLGAYMGSQIFNMNADVWSDLSEEERAAIYENLPGLVADVVFANVEESDAALQTTGVEIAPGSEALMASLEEERASEYDKAIADGEASGVEAMEDVAATMRENVDKWRAIVAEVGDDKEAYRQALWDEIYSKLD